MDSPANDPEMQKLIAMEVADIMEGMTTPTNWPNPERPGYPMFPEKTLHHVLKKKDTGEIIIRNWKSDGHHWDMIGHFAQWCSETYFYEGPVLTPAQITEMLTAERERCAKAAREVDMKYRRKWQTASIDADFIRGQSEGAYEVAEAIRNLGAAP